MTKIIWSCGEKIRERVQLYGSRFHEIGTERIYTGGPLLFTLGIHRTTVSFVPALVSFRCSFVAISVGNHCELPTRLKFIEQNRVCHDAECDQSGRSVISILEMRCADTLRKFSEQESRRETSEATLENRCENVRE